MKSKYAGWALLGLLALFMAVSCKSTPPPPPEEEPAVVAAPVDNTGAPPDQTTLNNLNTAAARAAAARKLAGDFGAATLFPQDWQSADSLYNQAEQQKNTSTQVAAQDSVDRYNKAADAFEALADKTLAQTYDAKQKELVDARNAAVNAGAGELVPDFLLDADNAAADAYAKYQAKDYYGAKDGADNALSMYTALNAGLDAYKVREEIAARGFEVYDPISIGLADDTLRSAAQDYSDKNFAAAKDKSDEALLRYNLSLKTAWESYSAEKGAIAAAERQKALDLKANVAVRQDYNSAQTIYAQANTAFQAQRYEEAANSYDESGSMFDVIAQVAFEKQNAAADALRKADQKMTESDETAKSAEVILEGGAQ